MQDTLKDIRLKYRMIPCRLHKRLLNSKYIEFSINDKVVINKITDCEVLNMENDGLNGIAVKTCNGWRYGVDEAYILYKDDNFNINNNKVKGVKDNE